MDSEWQCPLCTFLNPPASVACQMCNTSRQLSLPNEQAQQDAVEAKQDASPFPIRYAQDFHGLPTTGVVGSYGGGDAMQMARQILLLGRPPAVIPQHIKDKLFGCIGRALEKQKAIPLEERVAHLPDSIDSIEDWEYSANFQISSHVYGEMSFNLFYQGWLFEDVPKDPSRQGAVKYPLIGIFETEGILKLESGDVAFIGYNDLKWAEQHIHKVDGIGQNQWHFGTDMARFCIDPESKICSFWAVAVDLKSKKVDVTYMLIISGDLEDPLERMLRDSSPQNDQSGKKNKRFVELFLKSFEKELSLQQTERIRETVLYVDENV